MALIEDVFKGNLAGGLAIGVSAIVFGPTAIQTIGSILRPAAKTLIKGRYGFLPRNPERVRGNGD